MEKLVFGLALSCAGLSLVYGINCHRCTALVNTDSCGDENFSEDATIPSGGCPTTTSASSIFDGLFGGIIASCCNGTYCTKVKKRWEIFGIESFNIERSCSDSALEGELSSQGIETDIAAGKQWKTACTGDFCNNGPHVKA
ncbi:unnamed protein product, partial [Owenia fusiformis]